ncbi:MAG: hypothetical protein H6718_26845 [Polyangiaceae bacterium]|nr:hypothetical protein [Polyangiaceae bacterium]
MADVLAGALCGGGVAALIGLSRRSRLAAFVLVGAVLGGGLVLLRDKGGSTPPPDINSTQQLSSVVSSQGERAT